MAATSHDKFEQYETERVKLYKQQRSFAFSAAHALQTTYNGSVDANNVTRLTTEMHSLFNCIRKIFRKSQIVMFPSQSKTHVFRHRG